MAGALTGETTWCPGKEPVQRNRYDEPAIQQRGQGDTGPPRPKLGEQHRYPRIASSQSRPDRQRSFRSLFRETRDLGLVGHPEPGVEVGFERKLPQQRQAEGINRADLNLTDPITKIRPLGLQSRRVGRVGSELADDPLAHIRGSLTRERDGQDVGRVDAGAQEIEIPRHQDRGLSGARGCFEHDVLRRVGREDPLRCVRERHPAAL